MRTVSIMTGLPRHIFLGGWSRSQAHQVIKRHLFLKNPGGVLELSGSHPALHTPLQLFLVLELCSWGNPLPSRAREAPRKCHERSPWDAQWEAQTTSQSLTSLTRRPWVGQPSSWGMEQGARAEQFPRSLPPSGCTTESPTAFAPSLPGQPLGATSYLLVGLLTPISHTKCAGAQW